VIFQLFKRAIKHHLGFHLLIPLILIFSLSAWRDPTLRNPSFHAWLEFTGHWWRTKLAELIEVYVAFLLVIAWTVKRAGDIESVRVETLKDILPTAKRYFAIGIIPLWEWFDQSAIVYLCTIIKHQLAGDLHHERVLLFQHRRDLDALSVSYLDEPFAKAFSAIHTYFQIPLGYLAPADTEQLLAGLTVAQRDALGCTRRWATALRTRWTIVPERWTFRPLRPFALIEHHDGTFTALRFEKRGKTLMLPTIADTDAVSATKAVVDKLTEMIYKPGTHDLYERFKLSSLLCP
jgi:hypothetical protein